VKWIVERVLGPIMRRPRRPSLIIDARITRIDDDSRSTTYLPAGNITPRITNGTGTLPSKMVEVPARAVLAAPISIRPAATATVRIDEARINFRSGENRAKYEKLVGMQPDVGVTDNPQASRLELTVDGGTAVLNYERTPKSLVLVHTEVPAALRGQHLGDRLVESAIERARAEGLRIVAVCQFVRAYLRKHPEHGIR
jgi:uncharacterized protein